MRYDRAMVDLRTALKESLAAKVASEERRDEINADIESLEIEIKGLHLAIARRNGEGPTEGRLSPTEVKRWRALKRTDAVVKVLEESKVALGPLDVTSLLHERGRDDPRNSVAASLAYLQKQLRVHSKGRGQWLPGPPPDSSWTTDSDASTSDGVP